MTSCRLAWLWGASPSTDQVAAASDIRVAFTKPVMTPTCETLRTLVQLRAYGYPIGLITDCTAEVPALWPVMPLAPLIDHTVFSCREGITKPDPRIYLLACQKLGVSPEECVYVGDGSSQELDRRICRWNASYSAQGHSHRFRRRRPLRCLVLAR